MNSEKLHGGGAGTHFNFKTNTMDRVNVGVKIILKQLV